MQANIEFTKELKKILLNDDTMFWILENGLEKTAIVQQLHLVKNIKTSKNLEHLIVIAAEKQCSVSLAVVFVSSSTCDVLIFFCSTVFPPGGT